MYLRGEKNMERIEDKIRVYLAQHLNIISNDLELVKEEYYLKNKYGANGRIDILAKDQDNNYVIIEIKKSDQAARQALHEIAKYTALLKQELLVKDSEIRIIIVSTTWNELLIPFSETKKYSLYYLEGYKITLDSSNIPIDSEKIIPVDIDIARKFSRSQSLFLYTSNKDIKRNLENLEGYVRGTGFSDYLILEILTDDDIPYPVGLYFAHQKMSEEFYISVLYRNKKLSDSYNEACELKENEDFTEEEYINFLEQSIIGDNVVNKMECDSFEIGYPEKIAQALNKNWKVDKVHRYGIFSKDERMSDNMIIEEMCGLNGIGLHYYYNQCLSKYKAKLIEIKEGVRECLYLNSVWEGQIDQIFDELILDEKEYRVSISIFNPQDILGTIANIPIVGFSSAVPNYQISIEYLNENVVKIFYGIIDWRKKEINLRKIIKKFFNGDEFNYFATKHWHGIPELDIKILNDIGLNYSSELLVIEKENERESYYDLEFTRKKVVISKLKTKKHFDDFLLNNSKFIDDVMDFYHKNTNCYLDLFKT
jgi:Predicted nuclease of the RecB family